MSGLINESVLFVGFDTYIGLFVRNEGVEELTSLLTCEVFDKSGSPNPRVRSRGFLRKSSVGRERYLLK